MNILNFIGWIEQYGSLGFVVIATVAAIYYIWIKPIITSQLNSVISSMKDIKESFDSSLKTFQRSNDEKIVSTMSVITTNFEKEFANVKNMFDNFKKDNDATHDVLIEGFKKFDNNIDEMRNQLKDYSIINHDIYEYELNEISMTEKLCVLEVINLCIEQSLKVKNKGLTNHEDFFNSLRLRVNEMMTLDQAHLVAKSVHDRTIALWVETQHELFPVFENWILRKYDKLLTLKGNGSLDILIQDSWTDLGRDMTNEFMKRLKKKLVLKTGKELVDPVDWNSLIKDK